MKLRGADDKLSEFLTQRARSATDARLTLDVGVGIAAVIVAAALKPSWWPALAAAGACFAAFGVWATLDRIILSRSDADDTDSVTLRVKFVVALVGAIAAIVLGFILWATAIGTWNL